MKQTTQKIQKNMIKALVSDFSRVLLSPKDSNYTGGLNALHKKLLAGGTYDFWSYFQLNRNMLTFYKTIRKHIDVYMFTTEYIQEHPVLQPELYNVFKKIFSGARLGLKKTNTQSYSFIAKKVGLKPEEILYIDDKPTNLKTARKAGMTVICYESNAQAKKDIAKVLKISKYNKQ